MKWNLFFSPPFRTPFIFFSICLTRFRVALLLRIRIPMYTYMCIPPPIFLHFKFSFCSVGSISKIAQSRVVEGAGAKRYRAFTRNTKLHATPFSQPPVPCALSMLSEPTLSSLSPYSSSSLMKIPWIRVPHDWKL